MDNFQKQIEIASLISQLQLQSYLRRNQSQRKTFREYHVCERRCFHELSEQQQLHIKSLFGYACARETRNCCSICRYSIEAKECYYTTGTVIDLSDSIRKWKESRGIL
jgi:hypothetical protein